MDSRLPPGTETQPEWQGQRVFGERLPLGCLSRALPVPEPILPSDLKGLKKTQLGKEKGVKATQSLLEEVVASRQESGS